MAHFTMASHNILYSLSREKIRADLKVSGTADIVLYQEAGTDRVASVLRVWADENGFGLYDAGSGGNAIAWRNSVFKIAQHRDGTPVLGRHKVHSSAKDFGLDLPTPAKDFTFVGLVHRETLKKVLVVNVHPVAEATKRESDPDNRYKTPEQNAWADWAFGQYWVDVVAFTAAQMSKPVALGSTKPYWSAVVLGGDFNSSLINDRRWYYPAPILKSLYRGDLQAWGLDHLMCTRSSDLIMRDRSHREANSDHDIQFVLMEFRPMPDFPRDR